MTAALSGAQNADGGWGAQPGSRSWTETTAWAVLALHGGSAAADPVRRGLEWLRKAQLPAGGWPASPGVGDACWVSAVVALLPPAALGSEEHRRGLTAVEAGVEVLPGLTDRIRRWMLGIKAPDGPLGRGWPWVPGTAPWLVPTVLSILALEKNSAARTANTELLSDAHTYLLRRQCADGGWNHGSSRALGYDGASYPETTGLALLALRGRRDPAVAKALEVAARQARRCQTMEGACWLRLALHAHGQPVIFEPPARVETDIREQAIATIVERCMAGEGLLWNQ